MRSLPRISDEVRFLGPLTMSLPHVRGRVHRTLDASDKACLLGPLDEACLLGPLDEACFLGPLTRSVS